LVTPLRVVAIGDNVVDVYTDLGRGYPGGGAVNFAAHSARLGVPAGYVGVVGDDWRGRLVREALEAEHVDVTYLRMVRGPTAVAYVQLENGERTFVGADPGVRYQLRVDAPITTYLQGASLVHTTLDGRMEAHLPLWHAAGLRVSFDFSHRATPQQLALLPHVYIAFFSGQKIHHSDAEAVARQMHVRGGRLVVMTLGEHGSVAFDGQRVCRQAAEPQPFEPVDTLGAGDAFMAGFVVSYLRDGDVRAALATGTRAAGRACVHHGAFDHGLDLPDVARSAAEG
jgi:fructoselysine 6-kinase